MIRLRAVRSLLFEDIAELRLDAEAGDAEPTAGGVDGAAQARAELEHRQRAAIEKARTRAALVAGFDLLAILVLFAFRPGAAPFLVLGGSEEGVFTFGVLAIAVHAGYRLGQRQKLGALLRAWDTLPRRYDREPARRSA